MKPISQNILGGFNDLMKQRNVPPMLLGDYRKWLLYFLDFRAKYPLPDSPSDQIKLFADKLRSKHQTAGQVEQAMDAISLFFASRSGSKINPSLVTEGAPAATLPGQQLEDKGPTDRNSASAKTVPQIQTLLGHADVRTTMIYTHCVPSKTLKEIKSPLDF